MRNGNWNRAELQDKEIRANIKAEVRSAVVPQLETLEAILKQKVVAQEDVDDAYEVLINAGHLVPEKNVSEALPKRSYLFVV